MLLTLLIIILILTVSVSILSLVILFVLLYTKVPFVRSPKNLVPIIIKEANITAKDRVYDLGCGDAGTLIAIEKAAGATTVGFEITPLAYWRAKMNIKKQQAKTTVYYKNFYHENLSEATVVFCFLIDSVMKKVGEKLKADLKPGTMVLSYAFKIPQWQPIKTVQIKPQNPNSSIVYIYKR